MLNKGITFGLWQGIPEWVGILILLPLLFFAVKTRELLERVGILLIFVGGMANFIQRFSYGGVIDNWSLGGVLYNNVWDYFIFIGLIVYGYAYYRQFSRSAKQ